MFALCDKKSLTCPNVRHRVVGRDEPHNRQEADMNDDISADEPIESDAQMPEILGLLGTIVGLILLVAILGSMFLDPENGGVIGWLFGGLGGA